MPEPFREIMYPYGEPDVKDLGLRHFVRVLEPGCWLWWHDCPNIQHVSWGWIGRLGPVVSGHTITNSDIEHLTVTGSLLCEVCQDHGFIEDGKWRPC